MLARSPFVIMFESRAGRDAAGVSEAEVGPINDLVSYRNLKKQ